MKFDSQICTSRSQSEQLLALGLKKETADMTLFKSPNLPQYPFDYAFNHDTSILADVRYVPMVKGETPFVQDGNIPAWSLHRLIEIANLSQDWECISGNWYEEVIATIQSKIHIGELNKEYLEE